MAAWEEHEVYRTTMDTPLDDVDGVGGTTLAVFRRAGFTKVGDLYSKMGQEEVARAAAASHCEEMGEGVRPHWRALATRCINVIKRVRSAETAPFVPEPFICPITFVVMEDPCITKYGDTYERWAVEHEVDVRGADPLSRRPLTRDDLFQNKAMKQAIDYYEAHFMRLSIPHRVR